MCFSAKASFAASLFLTLAGIFNLRNIKYKSQKLFAITPLLFAVQQFSEGILWLALTGAAFKNLEKLATYSFLTFAVLIWPIWIPLALINLENNLFRKKILYLFLAFGITWSLLLSYYLFAYEVTTTAFCQHIYYKIQSPFNSNYWHSAFIYFIPTALPFFISTRKYMKTFGLVLLLLAGLAALFWCKFYTSVWCFFAAILSLFTYFIVKYQSDAF